MKRVQVRFTVSTNDNIYWATSEKAAQWFRKENDLVVMREDYMTPSISDQNVAEKCGRGVWVIADKG